MDDAGAVGRGECIGDLHAIRQRLFQTKLSERQPGS